jgi:hypothetical protein
MKPDARTGWCDVLVRSIRGISSSVDGSRAPVPNRGGDVGPVSRDPTPPLEIRARRGRTLSPLYVRPYRRRRLRRV